MSDHHTKRTGSALSQIFPSEPPKVASDATLADTYVGLCDWHGRVVWKSGTGARLQIGEEIWKTAASRSREVLRTAVARVVTLRENRTLEVENEWNEHFRVRMWPLDDPDIALAILAIRIPSELALLTDRETACLRCLARGMSTRDISKELDIGLTTVHTHLRRSRKKLGLTTGEALICFAARYFFVPPPIGGEDSAASRRQSG
jgi:DNA-binding CsgD family transcriptional regulator